MTKEEIEIFMDEMACIGDEWTEEQVEEAYSDCTLEEALEMRNDELHDFFSSLGRQLDS